MPTNLAINSSNFLKLKANGGAQNTSLLENENKVDVHSPYGACLHVETQCVGPGTGSAGHQDENVVPLPLNNKIPCQSLELCRHGEEVTRLSMVRCHQQHIHCHY